MVSITSIGLMYHFATFQPSLLQCAKIERYFENVTVHIRWRPIFLMSLQTPLHHHLRLLPPFLPTSLPTSLPLFLPPYLSSYLPTTLSSSLCPFLPPSLPLFFSFPLSLSSSLPSSLSFSLPLFLYFFLYFSLKFFLPNSLSTLFFAFSLYSFIYL